MSRWWTVKRSEAVWWKIPFSRGSIGAGGGWALGGFQKEEKKCWKKAEEKCSRKKDPLQRLNWSWRRVDIGWDISRNSDLCSDIWISVIIICRTNQRRGRVAWVILVVVDPQVCSPLDLCFWVNFRHICHLGQVPNLSVKFVSYGFTHLKVGNAWNQRQFHHCWGMLLDPW